MGLFSGLFGGGGSKSSSSTTVKVSVNPRIEVQNDLTPIQKAIEEISGIQTKQFKALEENQQQAAAFNAVALDSFLETLKSQQTLALIVVVGGAIWIANR